MINICLCQKIRNQKKISNTLIFVTASKNPQIIATYPPGIIGDLDIGPDIVERNPAALQYLSKQDLPNSQLYSLIEGGFFTPESWAPTLAARIGYLAPERLTQKFVDAIRAKASTTNSFVISDTAEEAKKQIRNIWASKVSMSVEKTRKHKVDITKSICG